MEDIMFQSALILATALSLAVLGNRNGNAAMAFVEPQGTSADSTQGGSQALSWVMSFMVAKSAPGHRTWVPDAVETREEAMSRYEGIARDILQVVYREEKPLFGGRYGRARTVSIILSIMLHESGFRRDIDLGLGKHARGDKGRSWCLMQLNIGDGRTTPWNTVHDRMALPADPPEDVDRGWTGEEITSDRQKCIRAGLRVIRTSFRACRSLPAREWLRVYASGQMDRGSNESRSRMDLAMRWFEANIPRTFTDDDVVKYLENTPPKEDPPGADGLAADESFDENDGG